MIAIVIYFIKYIYLKYVFMYLYRLQRNPLITKTSIRILHIIFIHETAANAS